MHEVSPLQLYTEREKLSDSWRHAKGRATPHALGV